MQKEIKVTKRQKQILLAIYNSLKNEGYPPTFDELKTKLNISSNQAIIDHLKALEKKKLIKREGGTARGLKLLNKTFNILNKTYLVPLAGTSYAGTLTQTFEIKGDWQRVSKEINRLDDNVFIIKVSGDSMINAGINNGDQLLVKEEKEFRSGDIVLAQTSDGTTIKRFISQDSKPYLFLKPENPKYNIIYFTDEITLKGKIIGKFISGAIKTLIQGRFI